MAKTVFLTIDLETGKAVQNFDDLKKTAKELRTELNKLPSDAKGFDALAAKTKLANVEVASFNKEQRATPSLPPTAWPSRTSW